MSNGNPALAGSPPTDPKATGNQHSQSGPNGQQSGANAVTKGDLHASGKNSHSEARSHNFIQVKGSKLEYGMAARFEIVLGLKNLIVGGFRTALDLAYNRTYNLNSFTTLFGGVRYEVIRPKKIEVVHGKKDDVAVGAKWERVKGGWTHTATAKEQKNQALFKEVVDSLLERSGAKLDRVISKYDAKWTKVQEDAKSLKQQGDKLSSRVAVVSMNIKSCKADIDKIDEVCKEFEAKSSQIDIAADSALSIKAPKNNIKGSMVSMKAGTVKFMGSLVKLGE